MFPENWGASSALYYLSLFYSLWIRNLFCLCQICKFSYQFQIEKCHFNMKVFFFFFFFFLIYFLLLSFCAGCQKTCSQTGNSTACFQQQLVIVSYWYIYLLLVVSKLVNIYSLTASTEWLQRNLSCMETNFCVK